VTGRATGRADVSPEPRMPEAPHRAHGTPIWTIVVPLISLGLIVADTTLFAGDLPGALIPVVAVLLFATVFAAVHHAETVAHRIGEPVGSILLAVAVTVIEVSLIVSILLGAPEGESAIARDTVFAAIMITLNGIVGLCLLSGGMRYGESGFQARAATSALAVLGTVAVLALVLPNFTVAVAGPVYATPQLVFVAIVSLALYGVFLYVQTVSHRGDFLDAVTPMPLAGGPPPRRTFLGALGMLPVALLAVVLLAELLAHPVETAVAGAGLPKALVGVIIALVVLMPEGTAALRAARANRVQTSLNLALGSALASICLTIPTIAILSIALDRTLVLGLAAEHIVLLVLSLFVATLTMATGRTTILHGGIHMVIFAAFVTLAAIP